MKTKAKRSIGILTSLSLALSVLTVLAFDTPLASAASVTIDTTSMNEVRDAYFNYFLPSQNVANGWTGKVSGCKPGAPSAAARDAALTTINYYRALAGLPSVTALASANTAAQKVALMIEANGKISKAPTKSWKCYTAAGKTSAGKSMMSFGFSQGTMAIPAWMSDDNGNPSTVNRGWILNPTQIKMGVGFAGNGAALQWGGTGLQGKTHAKANGPWDGVAWPPAGFFPWENMPDSDIWSFTKDQVGFAWLSPTDVSVRVSKNGGGFSTLSGVEVISGHGTAGKMPDPGVDWQMPALTAPAPGAIDRYEVTIQGTAISPIVYEVKVFLADDPSLALPGSLSITGTPTIGQTLTVVSASGTENPVGVNIDFSWMVKYGNGSTFNYLGWGGPTRTLTWYNMCTTLRVNAKATSGGHTEYTASSPSIAISFFDVPASHPNYSYICATANWGLWDYFNTAKTSFGPSKTFTRAALASALYSMDGPYPPAPAVSPFADVKATNADYQAIYFAVSEGFMDVTKSKGKLYFKPTKATTRAVIAVASYRYTEKFWGYAPTPAPAKSPFADVKATSANYQAIYWFYDSGSLDITKKNGKLYFKPSGKVTRAVAAKAFFYWFD